MNLIQWPLRAPKWISKILSMFASIHISAIMPVLEDAGFICSLGWYVIFNVFIRSLKLGLELTGSRNTQGSSIGSGKSIRSPLKNSSTYLALIYPLFLMSPWLESLLNQFCSIGNLQRLNQLLSSMLYK